MWILFLHTMTLCPYVASLYFLKDVKQGFGIDDINACKVQMRKPFVLTKAFLQLLFPFVWLLAASIISDIASLESYRIGRGEGFLPPMNDVVHRNTPNHFHHTDRESILFQVPDLIIVAVSLPCLILVISNVFQANKHVGVFLVRRICYLYGALVAMRGLCVFSTVFPSPLFSCLNQSTLDEHPPQEGTVISSIYCNDLMFSGHTMTNVLILCFALVGKYHLVFKIICLLFTCAAVFVTVLTRDHYTVDVVVATFITLAVFMVQLDYFKFLLVEFENEMEEAVWSNEDGSFFIRSGETLFFGRRHVKNNHVSRRHLRISAGRNSLVCTVFGRSGLSLSEKNGKTIEYDPGSTFTFTEKHNAISFSCGEQVAFFLVLVPARKEFE